MVNLNRIKIHRNCYPRNNDESTVFIDMKCLLYHITKMNSLLWSRSKIMGLLNWFKSYHEPLWQRLFICETVLLAEIHCSKIVAESILKVTAWKSKLLKLNKQTSVYMTSAWKTLKINSNQFLKIAYVTNLNRISARK